MPRTAAEMRCGRRRGWRLYRRELCCLSLWNPNKIGSQVYSPQMQLLPVVADDLNAAITAAFAAQVQNYEEHKGKPHIVTGFLN